jgi:hypothetical protein
MVIIDVEGQRILAIFDGTLSQMQIHFCHVYPEYPVNVGV